MDSRDIKNLCEAYVAVYDDGLRDEIEYSSMDEDLSFVDDLTDNELIQIMEEIFEETTIDLDECLNSLGFFLSEAVVTRGGQKARERRAATSTARITSSSDRRAGKTSERQQKVRIGRLAQAAQTAAEYPGKQARRAATAVAGGARAAAARAKTLAGGAASAAAGGAAEAGRKVQSAKEKVKGFLGKVGRAAKAGYRAAKTEFSGQAAREAQGRSDLRSINRTLRRQARERRGKDTREFGEEYDLYDMVLSHLLDEGYADTIEDAEVIMVNMSEEWVDVIVEEELFNEAVRGSERSIGNIITGNDIRSITRGNKTIYKKTPGFDRMDAEVRRSMGKEKHPTPYQLPYMGDKHDPRTREIKRNIGKLNAPRVLRPGEEAYKTVKTDQRARRERASGR